MTLQASGAAPARVVLIEDSEPIRQMISIYLTNNGMKVFEADTVSAGRRAVNLLKPQIVSLGEAATACVDMVRRMRSSNSRNSIGLVI